MKAIVNTKLVMEDGIIWDGAVLIEGRRIVAADRADRTEIPGDAERIDVGGAYTAPGLIDIHNHGTPDDFFYEKPLKCAEYFLAHGETTILPTFYSSLTMDEMIEGAEKIRKVSKSGAGRVMDGLYMEGPFMSGFGSNQKYIKWHGDIVPKEYIPLTDSLNDIVRIWAIDPMRKGIEDFMAYAKKKNPDVIFALGHSRAEAEQCRKITKYGIKVRTHITDAGYSSGRAQGLHGAGCDEYALYNPDMYAELICDQNGIHVVPDLIKLIVRTKGVEKICLITDSFASKEKFLNDESKGVWYGPDLNYDYEGKLAGSHLTLDAACRNMMTHTGYGLCHAIRMASINPARLLGIDDKVGSLEAGKKANLIVIDDQVNIQKVFLEGDLMVGA